MMKKAIFLLILLLLISPFVSAISQFNLTNGTTNITIFNGTTGGMTWTAPAGVSSIELLVVSGGGSGGSNHGGGGGAGGLSYNQSLGLLQGGTYNIRVGGGGAASSNNGTQSWFSNATFNQSLTVGGGGGNGNANAKAGGSGGGAGASPDSHVNQTPGTNVSGQGFPGGGALWFANYVGAGGGGGAGGYGLNNSGTGLKNGGNGGPGFWSIISGTGKYYACGGGGGSYEATPGWGGCNTSAAGDGGKNNVAGVAGTANTGSGGGGGAAYSAAGGAGAAGIVIISYATPPPTAAFSGTPTSGAAPLQVTFTDASTNSPTSWFWDFGDGNTTGDALQNPVHLYTANGTYTVALNASNAIGSDWENKTGYITVGDTAVTPLAMFTKNYWLVLFPRPIQFNDTSANTPTAWNWSFGDGKYSDSQNPAHQYVKRGVWTVLLNSSNTAGYSTNTSSVWILGG